MTTQHKDPRAELDALRGHEPVAGQSRFDGSNWAPCSIAHVRLVIEAPNEWSGYQVRYLYAAPVATPPVNAGLVEALKLAVRQNSHDMVMTGEELRKCESALSKAAQQKGGE